MPATDLVWLETSPHTGPNVTAAWTPAPSAALTGQVFQLYADATCTTAVQSPIALGAGVGSRGITVTATGWYSYTVVSQLAPSFALESACSTPMQVIVGPPAPGEFEATPLTMTEIRLDWQSGGGATDTFTLAYQPLTEPPDCATGTVVTGLTGTTDVRSGLVPETLYGFRLCAANSGGNLSAGLTASAATLGDGGTWTWIDGPTTDFWSGTPPCPSGPNEPAGYYPSPPSAIPPAEPLRPGARLYHVFVQTDSGPLLVGGEGCGGGYFDPGTGPVPVDWRSVQSDAWRRNTTTDTWEFVGGSHGFGFTLGWPVAKGNAALLRGLDGSLFLFGGLTASYLMDALHRSDDDGASWTLIWGAEDGSGSAVCASSGFDPANRISRRRDPARWVDSEGTFWFYGGTGGGDLADLWRFDPITAQWACIDGDAVLNQPQTATDPGSFADAAFWTGKDENLYLFGGGSGAVGAGYSSLWRYCLTVTEPCSPATWHTWTLVKGSWAGNQPGTYGSLGVPDATNVPGSRAESVFWMDDAGHFWLFGGAGFDEAGDNGGLNDLWRFDGTNWTWLGGSKVINDAGSRGALNVPAPTNLPDSRIAAAAVRLEDGSVLMYGGDGHGDLWRWTP